MLRDQIHLITNLNHSLVTIACGAKNIYICIYIYIYIYISYNLNVTKRCISVDDCAWIAPQRRWMHHFPARQKKWNQEMSINNESDEDRKM
jgi:hypothetical protein